MGQNVVKAAGKMQDRSKRTNASTKVSKPASKPYPQRHLGYLSSNKER